MALSGLYIPRGASWWPALRSELLSFPAGKHDDQVDALGLVGQLLDRMTHGVAAASPVVKPARQDYRRLESVGSYGSSIEVI